MLFEKIQLEDDEKVIKTVHKHWYTIFSTSVGLIITVLAPLAGVILIENLYSSYIPTTNLHLSDYVTYFVFLYSLWLLLHWMLFAHVWTTYYLDIWVITDRRVIVIDQVSLFRRHIGSFRLEKLQDVNIEINGIIATFLDYGVIEAETASGGHDTEFRTKNLPHPREIKSIILQAADVRMNHQNTDQTTTI
ncbi:MAG: hypothetical protein ACI92I_000173 [Acidimicrobiales bacterium]|jgi:hypothetical protein